MSACPPVRGTALSGLLGALLLVTAAGAQPVVPIDVDAAMTRGATGAPVTIVEFSDYQC